MPNTFKKKDSDPDYYAYVAPSEKREEPEEELVYQGVAPAPLTANASRGDKVDKT